MLWVSPFFVILHAGRLATLFLYFVFVILSLHCFSFTLSTFGARVGIVVYAGEMVEIQLGVVLGSGKLAVAEQLLHSADVAGVLQQMAGVAVAQHMGAEVSAAMVGGELL